MNKEDKQRRHPFRGFLIVIFIMALIATGVYFVIKNLNNDGQSSSDISGESSSEPVTLQVVFDMNGYHTFDNLIAYVGEEQAVTDPLVNRLGYNISWCVDQLGTIQWNFEDVVTHSMTLYAHWTIQEYMVSFDLNGGSGTTPQTQTSNYLTYDETDGITSQLSKPDASGLSKDGFVLDGWWLCDEENNFIQEWNFDADLVLDDMTLFAGWGIEKTVGHYTIIEYDSAVKIIDYDNAVVDGTLQIPTTILEKKVLSLGKDAFRSYSDAENIILPNQLTTINESAFYGSLAVYDLIIPNSVTSIGKMAFHSCATLYEVQIGSGVRNIAEMAFYQCTSLGIHSQISIPGNVISIEKQAFDIVSISKPFNDVVFNEGLEFIGWQAFAHLYAPTISLPDSLQHIAREAFAYTYQLGEIHLGKGLNYIGYDAFRYAQKADAPGYLHVYITAINPPVLANGVAFGVFTINDGVPSRSNFFIVVPENSVQAYKDDENWGMYYATRIVPFILS